MSMTVEKAISILRHMKNLMYVRIFEEEALQMGMDAIEEIQQYREYREIFESHFTEDALKLFSDKEEFSKWFERGKWHVLKCDELGREVEQYRAIGTVEELRALKEKATPKKPDYEADGYADGVLVYDYAKCPICGHDFEYGINDWESEYCSDCGQKLDWSEGKE